MVVRFAEKTASSFLSNTPSGDYPDDSSDDSVNESSRHATEADKLLTPGLNATTRARGFSKQESMQVRS